MDLDRYLKEFTDFPKPGLWFRDISPLLKNVEAFRQVVVRLADHCKDADKLLAIDARGFIFGSAVAFAAGKPLVMFRKKGKLPGKCQALDYDYDYASATAEVQKDAFETGDKVVVIDDVLATGGTIEAAFTLIKQLGAIPHRAVFVAEVSVMPGRARLEKTAEVVALCQV